MVATSAVVVANAVPPVATLYHLRAVPVATKSATVEPDKGATTKGGVLLQNT